MYLHASGLKPYQAQLIGLFWSFVWFYSFHTKLCGSPAAGIERSPREGFPYSKTNLGREAARQAARADFCNIIR